MEIWFLAQGRPLILGRIPGLHPLILVLIQNRKKNRLKRGLTEKEAKKKMSELLSRKCPQFELLDGKIKLFSDNLGKSIVDFRFFTSQFHPDLEIEQNHYGEMYQLPAITGTPGMKPLTICGAFFYTRVYMVGISSILILYSFSIRNSTISINQSLLFFGPCFKFFEIFIKQMLIENSLFNNIGAVRVIQGRMSVRILV